MSQEKILEKYKNKKWLYDQYIIKKKTLNQISDECGCSKTTIARYKDRFNLKKNKVQVSNKKYSNRDWLHDQYIEKNKTPIQISEDCNVNRGIIFEYISKFDLIKSKENKSKAFSNRIKDTSIKKYGVDHFNSSDRVIEKRRKTNLERYGKNTYLGSDEHRKSNDDLILIKNKTPYEWSLEYDISNVILYRWISKNPKFKDSEFEDFVVNYSPKISNIENILSQSLSLNLHNKYFDLKQYPALKYKPDFKISEKIAINADGLYWHSEKIKDNKKYHFDMRRKYEDFGLRIFQFRADEINYKMPIVKSIIENQKGKSKKIFARKTKVSALKHKDAEKFFNETHLMGSIKAKHFCLKHDKEVVMVLSYKIYKGSLKIERLSSKLNTVVVGGFSKLLKHCTRNLKFSNIDYWVDLRYGTGSFLLNHGFVLKKETLGWKWTDFDKTYNRLKCRANMDNRRLSEKDHAAELKWYKIYDAGQRLYSKERF
jgi:hypothetical protein